MLDIDAYLQRIHVRKRSETSLSFLKELQEQHMLNVPFENLDVIHKIPIPLNVESYYQKVVEQKRGGFCYELNGLFHWLLQKLGFRCHLVAGTIQRPDGDWALLESHAAQIVYLTKSSFNLHNYIPHSFYIQFSKKCDNWSTDYSLQRLRFVILLN